MWASEEYIDAEATRGSESQHFNSEASSFMVVLVETPAATDIMASTLSGKLSLLMWSISLETNKYLPTAAARNGEKLPPLSEYTKKWFY